MKRLIFQHPFARLVLAGLLVISAFSVKTVFLAQTPADAQRAAAEAKPAALQSGPSATPALPNKTPERSISATGGAKKSAEGRNAPSPVPKPSDFVPAVAGTRVFRLAGATSGLALNPKSTAIAQARMEGRQSTGRATPLDRASFASVAQLRAGDTVAIPVTDRETIAGILNVSQTEQDGTVRVGGSLLGQKGTFSFSRIGMEVHGLIQLPAAGLAFRVEPEPVDRLVLREILLSDVLCSPLPKAVEAAIPKANDPVRARDESGNLQATAVPILNSRPTATAQIYLDFDGETVTDPDWNGGNTIVAAASSLNSTEITLVFERVKEDFRAFNINVTTDVTNYNAAVPGNRMRCIITPTSEWHPGAGGVAYLNSFDRAGTWFSTTVPSWVFNLSVTSIAEAISHEIGHTFGLSHDGRTSPAEGYFAGHGSGATGWAPIMGVGYYKTVVQWSKGEYQNANNLEDDVAIISNAANGFGYASDEAEGTRGAATPLAVSGTAVNHSGVITSAADADFFSFTTTGGAVSIGTTLAPQSPNLDVALEIQNESGTVVAADNPAGGLPATLNTTLGAGSYYLKVSGAGAGDPLTDGYTTYGSIGDYTLTGTLNGFQSTPEIAVESPAGTDIATGGSRSFGTVQVGASTDVAFTIKNIGSAALNLTGSPYVLRSGSSDFNVISQPPVSSLGPNGSTTFTVRFTPTSNGEITGLLTLSHNDPSGAENGFQINLTGTGSNNVAPTDIVLSPASMAENNASNATVGTLSATDANGGDTHTFSIVSGTGGTDNASFTIAGNALRLTPSANFEGKNSYAVRIRAVDSGIGNFAFEKALTVAITNVNEMPSFTKGANQTVPITATSVQTISGWATAINDGDATVVQSFTFNVTGNTNPGLFSVQPAVSSNGTLTFTPSGATGVSTLSVTLTDDNSINGTPALTTPAQTFTITAQPPGTGAPDFLNPNVVGSYVLASAVQTDGKIIIAGLFNTVLGAIRNNIARLNADGTLDVDFNPNANNAVQTMVVQPDGRIVIGGYFTSIGGTVRNRVARLNVDGSLDTNFDPNAGSGPVQCLVLQPDGKILVGGSFFTLGTSERYHIGRVHANGAVDDGFNADISSGAVYALALQGDGNILVGGAFSSVGTTPRSHLARLSSAGVVDEGFNPGAGDSVNALVIQPDGKILVGGYFSTLGGSSRDYLGRLTTTGALDGTFAPTLDGWVLSMGLQADGKILVGGGFSFVNGSQNWCLARLSSLGARDAAFSLNVDSSVFSITGQADGKVLIGGSFGNVGTTARGMFARLVNDAATDVLSVPDSTQINWTRGGTAPELAYVTFERSIDNGVTWTGIGNGTRVGTTPNWQYTGLALTGNGRIRARGRTIGGYHGGSSSVIEATATYSLPAAPLPVVSSVTPATAGTVGGTAVTITGSNFLPAIGVSFGGTPATTFAIVNATTITATTPAHAAGAVDVTVSTPDNTGIGSGLFAYVAQPEIVVEQPAGTGLTDGSATIAFGLTAVGRSSSTKVFTISNTGLNSLNGIAVTRTGSSDFSLNTTSTALSLPPGSSTTFSVTFNPTSAGSKAGGIAIASNDADENPFDIALSGTGVTLAPGEIFNDTFANNNAGWTMDTNWAIGPAVAGSEDPAVDQTPDANNGIAGYKIGGTTGTAAFAARYFTSPSINTNVAGSVFLDFYRWLNADYPPYMSSTIDVWNGTAWVQIFAVPLNVAATATSWTQVQYDVTAHKNADFRVRFGVALTSGSYDEGSWNIDDLRIFSVAPEIAVEQPVGTGLSDGTSTSAFGSVNQGSSSAVRTYTIANAGTANLTGIAVSRTGSTGFVLNNTDTATSLAPGATTTFAVTFTPTSGGAQTGAIVIASNDEDENPFDIALTGTGVVNSAPTDITLSAATIAENSAPGTLVGLLTAIDVDGTDTHTFAFAGGADDAAFTITGRSLSLTGSANFEVKSSYAIRIRATDSGFGNLTFEKALTVAVTNVNEAPGISPPANVATNEDTPTSALAFTVSDPDAGAVLTVTAASGNTMLVPNSGIVLGGSGTSRTVTVTPAANQSGTATITLTVTDGGGLTANGNFTLTVNPVNDVPMFTKGGNSTHPFGTNTLQTIAGWATGIDDGDAAVTQGLTFNVTVASGAAIFTTQPAINSSTGTLTYRPNGSSGTATMSVTLTDDATAGGAALTSAAQTFTITVLTAPEIAVFTGDSTAPANERTNNVGTHSFGSVVQNVSVTQTFTIKNAGNADLTGLTVSATGAQSVDFVPGTLGVAMLPPNAATTFTVVFTPSALGARNAVIEIASNDGDENPFRLAVAGTGALAPELVVEQPAGTPLSAGGVMGWGAPGNGQISPPAEASGLVAIAGGWIHSLGLKNDGTVVGWGDNYADMATPPTGLSGVTAISAGAYHSLALKSNGTVVAWGNNDIGQLGIPAGLANVTAIAAGGVHSLALKSDGTVVSWGNGQDESTLPPGLTNVVAISASWMHSLALKADGTVVAWGYNGYGETDVPPDLSGVVAIAAGSYHSLAVKSDGTVVAWGSNQFGQSTIPPYLSGVVAVSAGDYHNLALKSDGTVVSWGRNEQGQINQPAGLTDVVAIAAGYNHSLALTRAKSVFASQLVGSTSSPKTFTLKNIGAGPLAISSITTVAGNSADFAVNTSGTLFSVPATSGQTTFSVTFTPSAVGLRQTTLRIATNDPIQSAFLITLAGTGIVPQPDIGVAQSAGPPLPEFSVVTAWGDSSFFGQAAVPPGLTQVTAIASGAYHTIALKSDGTVATWGYNPSGMLDVPAGLTGVVAISAGGNHSLALRSDGSVVAWGSNDYGESNVPPEALAGIVAIAAGESHCLALKSDGTVITWGNNPFGYLLSPPEGLTGVVAIAAGFYHSLALKNDGTVVAWGGYYNFGQINVPAELSNVVAIAGGQRYSLALKEDGTVVAWGDMYLPGGLTNVSAIAAGAGHALALKNDGSVVAWGDNGYSQSDVPAGLQGVIGISAGIYHSVALSGPVSAFGNQNVATSSPVRTFTVTNTGSDPLHIASVSVVSGHAADFIVNTAAMANTVAAPNGATTFAVTFTPTIAGARHATLRIASDDPDHGSYDISLTGFGTMPVLTGINPASGPPAGGTPVTLTGTRLTGSTGVTFGGVPATNVVVVSATTITAVTPAHALGIVDVAVTTPSGVVTRPGLYAYVAPEIVVEQPVGTEIATGGIKVFPAADVGASNVLEFTIRNTGNAVLNLQSTEVYNDDYFGGDFGLDTFPNPAVNGGGGSTTFRVRFAPAAGGLRTATLFINSNDSDEGQFTITLQGVGREPNMVLREQPLDTLVVNGATTAFGDVEMNAAGIKEIRIWNLGGATLNLAGIYLFSSDFTVISNHYLPTTVAPNQSTLLRIEFRPTSLGVRNATLSFNSNDVDDSIFELHLTGNGVPPAPEVYGINPTSGTAAGGTPITIQGLHFTGATAVTLGGVSATAVTVVDDLTITAVTGAHAAGVVDVAVVTPGGTGLGGQLFTYYAPNTAPVITSDGGGVSAAISLAENTTSVTDVDATDAEVPATQTLTFSKSGPDAGLFTINATTGVLTFTTAPNYEVPADAGANNVYDVTVTATDSFLPAASDSQALAITVTNANEAPAISDIANLAINEDTATSALVFTISDPDAGATLNVTASSGNTALVPNNNLVLAGSGGSRTVTATPVANGNGSAVITVQVSDGTLNASDTFTLTVNPVNDAPSFALASGPTVVASSGAASLTSFATGISPGPSNESAQTVSFAVTNNNNALFSVQPAIAANGTLTFTPGAAAGSATVTVTAQDTGGTANGGVNTSAPQTFVITVTPLNRVPVVAVGGTYSFTNTGSLIVGRQSHTASLLPDGKVLVAGGTGSTGSLASTEIYDPATGAWTAAAPLASIRTSHTASVLNNGKVLVVGGNGSTTDLAAAELYDPVANSWTAAGNLTVGRSGHTASVLNNGKVLVVGGSGSTGRLSSAELYDPVGNSWSTVASLNTARSSFSSTVLANGTVLSVGGYNSSTLASTELYDPATNTWTAKASLTSARTGQSACLLADGKLLVTGGGNAGVFLTAAEIYDPATNTWTSAGTLAAGRASHSINLLANGKVLIAAGQAGGPALSSTELFDPVSRTWSSASNLAGARYNFAAQMLTGGRVLIIGGSGSSFYMSGTELYAPAPIVLAEGASGTQTGTFSDADGNATVTLTASSGAITPFGTITRDNAAGTWTWTPPAGFDGPTSSTVTITATDDLAAVASASFTFTRTNTAPTVVITAATSAARATSVPFTFTATDPSTADQAAGFAWSINYGDGSAVETLPAGNASPLTGRTHTFANAGSFLVTATATDKDSGISLLASKTITINTVTDMAFEQWAVVNGLATGLASLNLDNEGDGLSNFMEWAFGTNPMVGSGPLQFVGDYVSGGTIGATGQPLIRSANGASGLERRALFVRRKDYATVGLIYTPRFSSNLASWENSVVVPTVLADDGTNQIVSVPFPALLSNGQPPKFFRVNVSSSP